jgi:CubicO group peptidase (beta-lactamase class C family)
VRALSQIDRWEVPFVAAAVTTADAVLTARGDTGQPVLLASLSKPVTALAVLVAAEEGTLDLDEPAGPPGATVRHLLAHASGLPFHGDVPISRPGVRRIYSNEGFRVAGDLLGQRAGMPFDEYVREAVCRPLGLRLDPSGHPGAGMHGSVDDVAAFARELLRPTVVAPETNLEMRSVQFPGLDGVLPDFGRFTPMDWGLGVEIKSSKQPHWSGSATSPATFGHFGGSGTFVWIDPGAGVACVALTTREFGEWAKEAWPRLSDAVLAELA